MLQLGTTSVSGFDPARDVRIIREPTVYLVGRQNVDASVFDRFLADHAVSWQSDTGVAAEYLAEIAGRLCYMSYARPRPGARTLRHFIEMRGSRHAEVEIRKLAIKVLQLMQIESPHLFSHYQLVPLPDGTFEADTPHRKV